MPNNSTETSEAPQHANNFNRGFDHGFDLGYNEAIASIRSNFRLTFPAFMGATPGCSNVEDAKLVVGARVRVFAAVDAPLGQWLEDAESETQANATPEINWHELPRNARELFDATQADLLSGPNHRS